MSKKRRPPATPPSAGLAEAIGATLPITGLKGILPKPPAPISIEEMKEKRGPLEPAAVEARDAQRGLGAELLLAIRQVKADLPQGALKVDVLALAPADQECFAKALLSPPKPTAAFDRAFARRRKLLRPE